MAQAISGENPITIDGVKYKVRTTVVYQDGLGQQGTLSTSAPLRYTVQYKPLSPIPLVGNSLQQWITLGERDVSNQNGWIFTPAAGAGFQKALIANGSNSLTVSLDRSTANALSKSSGVTAQQALQILQTAPNVAPTVVDPDQPVNGVPTPQLSPILDPEIKSYINDENEYEHLVYPTKIRENGQDYIKFVSFSYGTRPISLTPTSGFPLTSQPRNLPEIKKGSVVLTVQTQSPNTNSVQWGNEDLNPLAATIASLSYSAMSDPSAAISNFTTEAERILRENQNIGPAFRVYAAGRAAGINGLLSRVSGGILNPNMELLFQGPQLRPFTFDFRLSPRNSPEARTVKKIIRYFKQNMSVKTTEDNLFLKAPNVFQISYHNGGNGGEHTSINKIKKCALTSCSVNYTPDNQYMTFNDPDNGYPMTSYNITLQFQELEPVTDRDYKELNDRTAIGY